jgi:uncharacterized membrane protein YkgB
MKALYTYYMKLSSIDTKIILFIREISRPFARFSLFIIFFWFGLLKITGDSSAGPLVQSLLDVTFLNFIGASTFSFLFGVFEMVLGVLFLIPRLERIVLLLLVIHLVTTVMPLFLLPEIAWQSFLVPSLIGQYIIKNIVLLALMLLVVAHLHPIDKRHGFFSSMDEKVI